MTDDQFRVLSDKLDRIATWQENLSNHVEQLNISMGAMNSRLGSIELVTLRAASKVGVTGLPTVGATYIPPMPLEAKKPNGS